MTNGLTIKMKSIIFFIMIIANYKIVNRSSMQLLCLSNLFYFLSASLISRNNKTSSGIGGGGGAGSFFFIEFIAFIIKKRTSAISMKSMTACKKRPTGKIVLP